QFCSRRLAARISDSRSEDADSTSAEGTGLWRRRRPRLPVTQENAGSRPVSPPPCLYGGRQSGRAPGLSSRALAGSSPVHRTNGRVVQRIGPGPSKSMMPVRFWPRLPYLEKEAMSDTLVLDTHGFPVAFVSWQRAVNLQWQDRAVVVAEDAKR